MTPFYTRLRDYWEHVGKAMRGEAEIASVFPNTTDVGGSRERLYVEFLRAHVPAFCTVALGGFVFGADGTESLQMDVLVASGASLRFDFLNKDGTGKSFAAVDGLVAAISLKSDLDGKQIADAVQNLASIPPVLPMGGRYHPMGPPLKAYDAWPCKVIYAPRGVAAETALEHLTSATAGIPTSRWPDYVHVCGKYLLVKIGDEGGRTRDGTALSPNSYFVASTRPDPFGFGMVTQRIQEIEQSMRMMLFTYGHLSDNLPV